MGTVSWVIVFIYYNKRGGYALIYNIKNEFFCFGIKSYEIGWKMFYITFR